VASSGMESAEVQRSPGCGVSLLQSLVATSLRDSIRTRGTFADGRYPYGSCMMNG
jgi:hypothetical protein